MESQTTTYLSEFSNFLDEWAEREQECLALQSSDLEEARIDPQSKLGKELLDGKAH